METTTSYQLLSGTECGKAIREELAEEVKEVVQQRGRPPHLVAVLVGDDPASETYVKSKVKACHEVGIKSTLIHKSALVTEEGLLKLASDLNKDPDVDGFIVQLPLPAHIHPDRVTMAIDPAKDVDGFHPQSLGSMVLGLPGHRPATPKGITQLLKYYKVSTEGKHCVVVGRSNIVGTPVSILMSRNALPGNATVTLAHSRTTNLAEVTRMADILIVAVGKPKFITADMVKEGAVVVDVGIHRIPDKTRKRGYHLAGDVDFEHVAPKCSWITPVPGGVGPMTVTTLLMNTLQAAKT